MAIRSVICSIGILLAGYFVRAQQLALHWEKVAPGIWKAVAGRPEKVDLLGTAGIQPRKEALQRLGERDFPFPPGDCATALLNGIKEDFRIRPVL